MNGINNANSLKRKRKAYQAGNLTFYGQISQNSNNENINCNSNSSFDDSEIIPLDFFEASKQSNSDRDYHSPSFGN